MNCPECTHLHLLGICDCGCALTYAEQGAIPCDFCGEPVGAHSFTDYLRDFVMDSSFDDLELEPVEYTRAKDTLTVPGSITYTVTAFAEWLTDHGFDPTITARRK